MSKKVLIKDICVIDIEANDWTDHVVTGVYNGIEYKEFFNLNEAIEFIFEGNQKFIYAHFGGIFDFLHIINVLLSDKAFTGYSTGDFILQGRKILSFSVRTPLNGIFTFRCSSGLFPFALATLTEMFQVEHLKGKFDFSKRFKYSKKLSKYLESDCKGLYEVLEKYCEIPYVEKSGLKLTRSGQTFDVFSKNFASKLYKIPREVQDMARIGYFGGRTEIFNPLYINKKKPLNYYDINSLYPAVMAENKFPAEFQGWTNEYYDDCFGIYDIIIRCPKMDKPLLATKCPKTDKLIFPVGVFRGVYTNVEINKAIELGYEILEVKTGALFDCAGYYFKEYIEFFYNKRLETKDEAEKIFCKDMMNHLYGRFALNLERENITLTPSENSRLHSEIMVDDSAIRFYSEDKTLWSYTNVVLAMFVTSYARLKLYTYIEKNNVYYCDTDSIFTPDKIPTSKKLGAMKLEAELKDACFLLPKTYMTKSFDGDLYKKMKGFPNKALDHIDFDTFVSCLEGEMRLPKVQIKGGLAGIKTALKKGKILHVLPDSEKQLKAVYDKRIIRKVKGEYITTPHELSYQQELF
jgi:hypothetical protein